MRSVSELIARVRAEYMEMPGLALTAGQVERLCGIEQAMCRLVLDTLIAGGFLCVKPDGRYARLTEGQIRQRLVDPAKANPSTIMPAYYRADGLTRVAPAFRGKTLFTAEQVEDVVAYLMTLR